MNVEAVARYLLTALLIGGAVALLLVQGAVPEWYVGVVGLAVGNTFRLQVTAKK